MVLSELFHTEDKRYKQVVLTELENQRLKTFKISMMKCIDKS